MSDVQYPLIAKLGEAYLLSRRREVATEQIEVTAYNNFVKFQAQTYRGLLELCSKCERDTSNTKSISWGDPQIWCYNLYSI